MLFSLSLVRFSSKFEYFLNIISNFFLIFNNFILYSKSIDYKNIYLLRRFVTMQGKIIPKRINKLTTKQQRLLTNSL